MLVLVSNLPEGVSIWTCGGLNGYSLGKINFPWYHPPSYSVLSGPLTEKCMLSKLFASGMNIR